MHHYEARLSVEKMAGEREMTNKEKRHLVLTTAKSLAEGLCKVIKNGRMFGAFLNAGVRLKRQAEISVELLEMYDKYLENPHDDGTF